MADRNDPLQNTIIHAIKHHDNKSFDNLLNSPNFAKDTVDWGKLLHISAETGNEYAINALHKRGMYVNTPNSVGTLPVSVAAHYGHWDCVSVLLGLGADVNSTDHEGMTLLALAVSQGNIQSVEDILIRGGRVRDSTKQGKAPIHFAAESGNCSVMELLIDNKADQNAFTEYGWSPLHFAAHFGNTGVANTLIKEGAEINLPKHLLYTALHSAAEGVRNTVEVIKLLMNFGLKVNAATYDGKTPLALAIQNKKVAEVRTLINCDATVTLPNADGNTPLHLCALIPEHYSHERNEIAKILIRNGASLENRNNSGKTPIEVIPLSNRSEEFHAFLKTEVDKNVKRKSLTGCSGETAGEITSHNAQMGRTFPEMHAMSCRLDHVEREVKNELLVVKTEQEAIRKVVTSVQKKLGDGKKQCSEPERSYCAQDNLVFIFDKVARGVNTEWRRLFRILTSCKINDPMEIEAYIASIIQSNQNNIFEQAYASMVKAETICGDQFTVDLLLKSLRKCEMNLLADETERISTKI